MEQGSRVWAEGGDSGGGYAPATSRMAESGGSAPAVLMGHGVEAGVGGSGHQITEEADEHAYDQDYEDEQEENGGRAEEEDQYEEGSDENADGEEEAMNLEDQQELYKLVMLKKLKEDLERELLMKERLEKEVQLQELLRQEAQVKQLLALKLQEKAQAENSGRVNEEPVREQKHSQPVRNSASGSQRNDAQSETQAPKTKPDPENVEQSSSRQNFRPAAPQRPSTASSRGEFGDSDATTALLVKMKDTIEMLRTQLKRKDEEVLQLAQQKQELLELVEKMDAMKAIEERQLEEAVKAKLDQYEDQMKTLQNSMQEKISTYSQFKSKYELAEKEKENIHKTLVESSTLNRKFKDLLGEKQKVIDQLVEELEKFGSVKEQVAGALKINQDQKALLEQKDKQIGILNEKLDQMAEISKEFMNVQNFVGQASTAIKEMKAENENLAERVEAVDPVG